MTVTRTEVERLARGLRDEMVLSVVVDGTVEDPAMLHAWRRSAMEAIAAVAASHDGEPRAEREPVACAAALAQAALPDSPALIAGGAWVAYATAAQLELAGTVPRPIGTQAGWARGPRVGQVLAALAPQVTRHAVLVDSVSAAVYRCTADGAERLVHLHAHVADSEPTHMGAQPREHFHPGTRGRTSAEAAQLARREGHRRMMADLAERAERLAGRTGLLVVGGEPSAAREAAAALAERCPRRVARAQELRMTAAEHEIVAAVNGAAVHLEHAREQALLARVIERAGAGGRGVIGRESAQRAIEQGAVRELLVSATAFDPRRPDAAAECEALVGAALAQGARVTVLVGVAAAVADLQADGIAAELRFVPAAVAAGPAPASGHGALAR